MKTAPSQATGQDTSSGLLRGPSRGRRARADRDGPNLRTCLLGLLTLRPLMMAHLLLPLVAGGCASVPLKEAGTLKTYHNLGEAKGMLSKSRRYVDASALASMKTVRVVPTTFTRDALSLVKTAQDRMLVANALDREVCVALSDKFQVVASGEPADLTVRTVVTDVLPTDKTAAGLSTAVSLGGSAAGLPVGIPRLPVGLGGLAVEAEATDSKGVQRAAMVWARGANSISNGPRVSEVGDAYSLATTFGTEFSRMLVTGSEPSPLDIAVPSGQRIQSWLGGKPKYSACDSFGRAPGLSGIVAGKFGAPPEWTDKPSETVAQQ